MVQQDPRERCMLMSQAPLHKSLEREVHVGSYVLQGNLPDKTPNFLKQMGSLKTE